MKACSYTPATRSLALPAPQSRALSQMAAYALGATLWAPTLAAMARFFENTLDGWVSGLPLVGAGGLLIAMWLIRFVLYFLGAHNGWNYGYGVNGVVMNRRLALTEKVQRIGTDWFGIVLTVVAIWFITGVLAR